MKYLFTMLLMLSGCVSETATLRNPDTGDVRQCRAAGFGVIGAPVAMAVQSDCVKQLRAQGYK
jgi:hypothetical protein